MLTRIWAKESRELGKNCKGSMVESVDRKKQGCTLNVLREKEEAADSISACRANQTAPPYRLPEAHFPYTNSCL